MIRTLLICCLLAAHVWKAAAYDPLAAGGSVSIEDFTILDPARGREIPVRIYLPASKEPAPVVLFSHGLGGSREGSSYLGKHWAARGYAAVFLQHPGSDSGVWKNVPSSERMAAMNRAASAGNLILRTGDVRAALDALARWNVTPGHALCGRLDPGRTGMSGHSFGAVTTQAVSGQTFHVAGTSATDPRIKAAIAFSPGVPRRGDPARAFGSVSIPWMLLTGTRDVSIIGNASAESRQQVFPALPPGSKYELVLDGAEHSAFTDSRDMPGRRNPAHHRSILAVTTAFWDTFLKGDKAAGDWLNGNGPHTVINPADRWQHK